jgi:Domain of unknown function (DUF4034)
VINSASLIPCPGLRSSLSILAATFLLAICAFATDTPPAKPSPCTLTAAETAGLSGDVSSDVHAIPNFTKAIDGLLKAEKFEQLDCLADSARSHKELFPGGMWKIHIIYGGLQRPPLHPTSEDWETHLQLLQRWVSTRPQSITARVALAESYVNYGWDARGSGLADSVSESGWKLLEERASKAKEILEQASTLSAKCPEWYVAMQNVALAQSWEPEASQALFDQAVKYDPSYYYYYRLLANSMLPKWGGEEGQTEKFLQSASDRIGGEAGDILYYRVASTVVCGCPNDQQLKLSWPRILKGFDAVEKQNGAAPENWNLLAHMAYAFNDAVVADKMFARIGDQWSEDIWRDSSVFESAKQWAKHVEPLMARKQAAEDSAAANLHTAEGPRYKTAVDETIHSWIQPCVAALPATGDLGNFELLIRVGKDGSIVDMTGGGASPITPCLARKLGEFRQANQAVFPPPPQADYWVRFDFNPENSGSVAQK